MANFVVSQIVLAFACIICLTDATGTVLHHPKSRLVPVGVEVIFTCIIRRGVNPHWVIDERALAYEDSINSIAEEGYIIERLDRADDVTSLTLTFNVTMDKNGTTIYCSSLHTHSNIAILLSINECPLMQNPFIMNPNASSILLKWSPPFLWPGCSIHHYNISIDWSGERTKFYYVNSTYSDAVVSFLKVSDNPTEAWSCNEMLFGITAVTDNGTKLSSFTVVGRYLPKAMNITTSDVNITVLFEQDRSPLVVVNVKLPRTICSYQCLNYSIIIEGDEKIFRHGPYQHCGLNPIRETISSGLEENKQYTLMVILATEAGTSYSQQYSFNTSLQIHDHADQQTDCTPHLSMHNNTVMTNVIESSIYKVMLGVFVGVTTILLLILIMCLCALCQIRKRKSTTAVVNSTNRVFNTMTNNPIYDGPVYDSIVQSQFDTLPIKASEASNNGPVTVMSDSDQSTVTISETNDNSESVAHDRYVQQSCQSKSFLPSLCTNSPAPSTDVDVVNVSCSTSVSTQSACSITTLQGGGNKQKRLFLTLPTYRECTESDNDGNFGVKERPKCNELNQTDPTKNQAKDDEDNKYTVMRPIGTVTGSLDDGGHATNGLLGLDDDDDNIMIL